MGMLQRSVKHAIQARRARVKEMIDSGRSYKEITAELGTTKMTVIRDRAALGYAPWREDHAQEVIARRAHLKELFEAGRSSKEIATELGINKMTVIRDCAALGIELPHSKESITRSASERRAAVREEYERKTPVKEIAAKLGVSHMTVRRDIEQFSK